MIETWIEEAWFLASLIGALVSVIGIYNAVGDYRALGNVHNGRRMIAWRDFRTHLVRCVVLAAWAYVGYLAMTDGRARELSLALAVVVLGNVAFAVLAVLDLRDRLRLLTLLR